MDIHCACSTVVKYTERSQLIINNYSPKWRYKIFTTSTDTEVNNCFSKYHTSSTTSGPKSNFICDNMPTKEILFFFDCSEVNSTWLITSELTHQRARKGLFTCVVYTYKIYMTFIVLRDSTSMRNTSVA